MIVLGSIHVNSGEFASWYDMIVNVMFLDCHLSKNTLFYCFYTCFSLEINLHITVLKKFTL